MTSFIEVTHLKKYYGKSNALNDVSLKMESGQHYCIQGASGSGKSTLLYLIGGLETPTSGEIKVDGNSLFSITDEKLAIYRNRFVGFVFQFHFLLPSMDCLDNILLPARIGDSYSQKIKKNVEDLAERLEVTHCLKKFPFELSGGEQQRINLVRALSLSPKLLLLEIQSLHLSRQLPLPRFARTFGIFLCFFRKKDVAQLYPKLIFRKPNH